MAEVVSKEISVLEVPQNQNGGARSSWETPRKNQIPNRRSQVVKYAVVLTTVKGVGKRQNDRWGNQIPAGEEVTREKHSFCPKKIVPRSTCRYVLEQDPQITTWYPSKKDLSALRSEESRRGTKKSGKNGFVPGKPEKEQNCSEKFLCSPAKKSFHPRKRSEEVNSPMKITNLSVRYQRNHQVDTRKTIESNVPVVEPVFEEWTGKMVN